MACLGCIIKTKAYLYTAKVTTTLCTSKASKPLDGVLNIPYLQAGNSLTARCAHLQPQAWIMAVKYTPFPLVALNIINTNLSGTKVLTH